jgi:hypothetical protein
VLEQGLSEEDELAEEVDLLYELGLGALAHAWRPRFPGTTLISRQCQGCHAVAATAGPLPKGPCPAGAA